MSSIKSRRVDWKEESCTSNSTDKGKIYDTACTKAACCHPIISY